jgi:hypothetical protein
LSGSITKGILKMTNSIKKSVKISDDGFLKSTKDLFTLKRIDYAGELKFLIPEDDSSRMRLADLKKNLSNQSIFQLPPEDAERLCQIAADKCEEIDEEDVTTTWINVDQLLALIANA